MPSLCCASTPPWRLPGLRVPRGMLDRNYGCGSTVHPRDLASCVVAAGFGTREVRSKRPYRVLDRARYGLDEHLLLDTVELVAIADPVPADGPCVFTGRTATRVGVDDVFDDGEGHRMTRDLPLGVCDKTAGALAALGRDDLVLTGSTWHYAGDGCC